MNGPFEWATQCQNEEYQRKRYQEQPPSPDPAGNSDTGAEPDTCSRRKAQRYGIVLLMDDDARSEKPDARDDALNDAADVIALMRCGKIHARDDEQRRSEADRSQCSDARSLAMEVAVEADSRAGESRKAQSHEDIQVFHCRASLAKSLRIVARMERQKRVHALMERNP